MHSTVEIESEGTACERGWQLPEWMRFRQLDSPSPVPKKARDRGHPQLDRARYETGTTRGQLQGQYYWGGRPVAYHKGSQAHFQHQDWLGTERLRTTYNGAVEGTFTSLPFGDDQATASGTDGDAYHFAQLEDDTETETDHAQFRQYSTAQGRWQSPDPYSGSYDFSNPQSFDRYVYALNNPLAAVDPSGLDPNCVVSTDANGQVTIYCNDDADGTNLIDPNTGQMYVVIGGIAYPIDDIGYGSGLQDPEEPNCSTDPVCQLQFQTFQLQQQGGAPSTATTIKTWAVSLAALAYVSEVPTCSKLASQSTTLGRLSGAGGIYSGAAAVTGVALPAAAAVGTASAVGGAAAFFGDIASWLHIGCRE